MKKPTWYFRVDFVHFFYSRRWCHIFKPTQINTAMYHRWYLCLLLPLRIKKILKNYLNLFFKKKISNKKLGVPGDPHFGQATPKAKMELGLSTPKGPPPQKKNGGLALVGPWGSVCLPQIIQPWVAEPTLWLFGVVRPPPKC